MTGPVETTPYAAGVWVAFGYESGGAVIRSVHAAELEARRAAAACYGEADFVPFAAQVSEVLR